MPLSKISFYQELVISYFVFGQRVPYTPPNIKLFVLYLFTQTQIVMEALKNLILRSMLDNPEIGDKMTKLDEQLAYWLQTSE